MDCLTLWFAKIQLLPVYFSTEKKPKSTDGSLNLEGLWGRVICIYAVENKLSFIRRSAAQINSGRFISRTGSLQSRWSCMHVNLSSIAWFTFSMAWLEIRILFPTILLKEKKNILSRASDKVREEKVCFYCSLADEGLVQF